MNYLPKFSLHSASDPYLRGTQGKEKGTEFMIHPKLWMEIIKTQLFFPFMTSFFFQEVMSLCFTSKKPIEWKWDLFLHTFSPCRLGKKCKKWMVITLLLPLHAADVIKIVTIFLLEDFVGRFYSKWEMPESMAPPWYVESTEQRWGFISLNLPLKIFFIEDCKVPLPCQLALDICGCIAVFWLLCSPLWGLDTTSAFHFFLDACWITSDVETYG